VQLVAGGVQQQGEGLIHGACQVGFERCDPRGDGGADVALEEGRVRALQSLGRHHGERSVDVVHHGHKLVVRHRRAGEARQGVRG
jgi:hypothetical protein